MGIFELWVTYNNTHPNTVTFDVLDAAVQRNPDTVIDLLQGAIDSGEPLSDDDFQETTPGVYLA